MKLLIVDNSDFLLQRLEESYSKANKEIEIRQVQSFNTAIKVFPVFNPDIIILDIDLPDGNGIQLLQKFKRENPLSTVIIFADYNTSEFRKSCIDLGADDYFEKSHYDGLIDSIGLLHKISNKN